MPCYTSLCSEDCCPPWEDCFLWSGQPLLGQSSSPSSLEHCSCLGQLSDLTQHSSHRAPRSPLRPDKAMILLTAVHFRFPNEPIQSLKAMDLVHLLTLPRGERLGGGHSSTATGSSSFPSHQVFILVSPTAFLCISLFKLGSKRVGLYFRCVILGVPLIRRHVVDLNLVLSSEPSPAKVHRT